MIKMTRKVAFFVVVVVVELATHASCTTFLLNAITSADSSTSYNLTTYLFKSYGHQSNGSEENTAIHSTTLNLPFYNRIVRIRGVHENLTSNMADRYILQTYDTLWLLTLSTKRTELIYTGTFEIVTINVYDGRSDMYIEWVTRSMRPWCVLEYHSAPLSVINSRLHVSFCLLDHKNKKHPTYEESEVVGIRNDTIFAIGQDGITSSTIVHRWPIKNRFIHWRSTHQTVTSFCDVDHTHLVEVSNAVQMVVVLTCKQYGDVIPLAYLNVDVDGYISFYEYEQTQYDIIYSFAQLDNDIVSRVATDKVYARYADNSYIEYTLREVNNCTVFDNFYLTKLEEEGE